MLLSSALRKRIVFYIKNTALPLWGLLLVVTAFLISDTVEHNRLLSPFFLQQAELQSLIEEIYEIPFMIGLFLTSFYFMKKDKNALQLI